MQIDLQPIIDQFVQFVPRLISAVVLLLVAWILARVLKAVVRRLLTAVRLDKRVGFSLTKTIADIVYWLVLLIFLPAILDALGMLGLLAPVQSLVNQILGFLPNLFAGAAILLIGWLVAHIVRQIVTGVLSAVGVDRLSERVGLAASLGPQKLSGVLGLVVFALILIPALTAGLSALGLESVSRPISNMLNTILAAIPNIFAAAALLVIAYVVGRLVSGLVTNLLSGLGFNAILTRLGLSRVSTGQRTPSAIVGSLVLVAIMLFASIEAVRVLGMLGLAELLTQFTVFAGQVVLGLIILALGLYLANLAAGVIAGSQTSNAGLLAGVARAAILVLAMFMALRQMGLAPDIINLAFSLSLGAVAVAVALAFGLGGRETARRLTEEWAQSLRAGRSTPDQPDMSGKG